jgi:sporulation protein YabP
MEQGDHLLTIENLKKVTATAIVSVDSFSENQMVLSYSSGRIIIGGNNLKITSFSQSSGAFSASGNIANVKYAGKGVGLKQKLFK